MIFACPKNMKKYQRNDDYIENYLGMTLAGAQSSRCDNWRYYITHMYDDNWVVGWKDDVFVF